MSSLPLLQIFGTAIDRTVINDNYLVEWYSLLYRRTNGFLDIRELIVRRYYQGYSIHNKCANPRYKD